ncbi:hypothetical protein [Ktedonospora formicarum]|uniref:Uncharacterized protein n=1 Tax=Ktedonospora formicarum TaxID=2778364 RepID=A0A8J3I1A0_9CHLR|nr:hypothetical protein [Ktedonospora formicarum]GHO45751.1 hypothetical protein KSX_39140 [Ktedonospora formicarum]
MTSEQEQPVRKQQVRVQPVRSVREEIIRAQRINRSGGTATSTDSSTGGNDR